MKFKGFLTAGLFLVSNIASATVTLIVTPLHQKGISEIARVLKHPLILSSEPVFSPSEKTALNQMGAKNLAESYLIQVEAIKSLKELKKWSSHQHLDIVVEPHTLPVKTMGGQLGDLQWGLHNDGRPVKFETSSLVSIQLPSKAGEDIGLQGAPPEDPTGKKIRVAVLDTGVDLEHPALQSKIVRHPEECEALEKYKICLRTEDEEVCDKKWAKIDANHNGYPLDCNGWNVTTGKNPLTGIYGSYNPTDDTGHGTHIAGIIAAEPNVNGIRGLSQNIEILPVKVIKNAPNAPIRPQENTGEAPDPDEASLLWSAGFADVIARGMLYAIRANAQVINLSLGWTSAVDSQFMRAMVELALSRGILFVTAAGNDSSDVPILPCEYDGVICVASHGPDGGLSHFSNYGSFVDLAAPGLQILSTYPLNKRSNNFTALAGYEIKDGTSMAAPFVAGALARLLSTGYSSKEAYARILAGTRPTLTSQLSQSSYKFIRWGNTDLGRSFRVTQRPLIFPEHKKPLKLFWDRLQTELPLSISLKNFWGPAKNVHISAEVIQEKHLQFSHLKMASWDISEWLGDTSQTIQTSLIIDHPRIDGRLLIAVKIVSEGVEPNTIYIPVDISVTINKSFSDPSSQSFPLVGGSVLPNASLRSVTALDGKSTQDYLAIEDTQSHLKIQLIEQKINQYEITAQTEIDTVNGELRLIHRLDLNQNGSHNYIFIFGTQPFAGSRVPGLRFVIFDEKLKLQKTIDYDNKISAIPDRFQWLKLEDSSLVPFWLGFGTLPLADKPPFDPWNPDPQDIPQLHLYYLTDAGVRIIPIPEEYSLVQLLAQSLEHKSQGKVSLILSKGEDYKLTYYTTELNGKVLTSIRPLTLSKYHMLLGLNNILEITPLDTQAQMSGTALAGSSVRGSLRTTLIIPGGSSPSSIESIQNPPSKLDSVMKIVGAFIGNQRQAIFAQTHYQLEYQDLNTGQTAFTSLNRFSLLPGLITNITLFPIVAGSTPNQDRIPGIFIAASLGIADGNEVVTPVYDSTDHHLLGLSHPARLRLIEGEDCESIANPIPADASAPNQFMFFCEDRFLRIPVEL